MKIRLARADAEFATAIKERDGWTCRLCGRTKAQGYVMHAAHVFTRRARSTRWDPQNCYTLCFVCHRFAHEWPTLFHQNIREWLGDEMYEALERRAKTPAKVRETR